MNAQSNVIRLTNKKISKKNKLSRRETKARRWQRYSAYAVASIALTLTALSLSHLAHGIELVTHAPIWEAWAMAIGIDLGFLACEFSHITVCSSDASIRLVHKFAKPTVIGTLVASAIMNAYAFGASVEGLAIVPSIVLGVAIPAMIYSLTRIGIAMYK